jgi:hypothetical protein
MNTMKPLAAPFTILALLVLHSSPVDLLAPGTDAKLDTPTDHGSYFRYEVPSDFCTLFFSLLPDCYMFDGQNRAAFCPEEAGSPVFCVYGNMTFGCYGPWSMCVPYPYDESATTTSSSSLPNEMVSYDMDSQFCSLMKTGLATTSSASLCNLSNPMTGYYQCDDQKPDCFFDGGETLTLVCSGRLKLCRPDAILAAEEDEELWDAAAAAAAAEVSSVRYLHLAFLQAWVTVFFMAL